MAAEVYECPSCGATVAAEATECPKCGEIFEASALQVEPTKKGRKTSGRRERLLFYAGVLLVLAGGPGIAVGSWLHDFLRIPIGGLAFESFGWGERPLPAGGVPVPVRGVCPSGLSLR